MPSVTCPSCGTRYRVDRPVAGKWVRCKCGIRFDSVTCERERRIIKPAEDEVDLSYLESMAQVVKEIQQATERKPEPPVQKPTQPDTIECYEMDVVGESHYQRELEEITGGKTTDGVRLDFEAVLILDDANPYDPNAVRVEIWGYKVGHLSREDAVTYRRLMKKAGRLRPRCHCYARVAGGWDRGNGDVGFFGVKLFVPKS